MEQLNDPNEWQKNTILANERGVLDYSGGLGLYLEDFYDGKVLDLGSGGTQLLNQHLQGIAETNPHLKLHADIVSVSPDMVSKAFRQHLKESPGYEAQTVAAIGQQLPFASDSFDRVISLGGVVNYAGFEQGGNASEQVVQAWMSEVVRVLKPGGEARLGMIYGNSNNQAYLDTFAALGLEADITIEQALDENNQPYLTTTYPPQNVYRIVIRKSDD